MLAKVQLREESEVDELEKRQQEAAQRDLELQHAAALSAEQQANSQEAQERSTFVREQPKVGRNEPCPCGSGKKYKHRHGKLS